MAKYEASPYYCVKIGASSVHFDVKGYYETENAAEIAALDALCPTWIKRVDQPEVVAEPKAPRGRKSGAASG